MHTSAAAMYSDSRVHPSNTTTDAPEAARPHANRHHRSSDAVLDDAILAAQAGAAAEVAVTKVKWWTSRRARIFGTLLAGAISFSLYRFITGERARYRQELVYVEFIAQTYAAEIERQLRTSVSSTITLAAVLSTSSCNLNDYDFTKVAASLYRTLDGITNLQLAPGGVISQIYPLEGHEGALGLSLLSHPIQRAGALRSIDRRRETFVGPIRLVQGNVGVIARHPVFNTAAPALTVPQPTTTDDGVMHTVDCAVDRCRFPGPPEADGTPTNFWGFATMLTLVDDLVAAVRLAELESNGFEYQLAVNSSRTADGATPAAADVFASSAGAAPPATLDDAVWARVEYAEADVFWSLAVRPRRGWTVAFRTGDFWLQCALLTLFTMQSLYTFYKAQSGRATALTLKRVLHEERLRQKNYERRVSATFQTVRASLSTSEELDAADGAPPVDSSFDSSTHGSASSHETLPS